MGRLRAWIHKSRGDGWTVCGLEVSDRLNNITDWWNLTTCPQCLRKKPWVRGCPEEVYRVAVARADTHFGDTHRKGIQKRVNPPPLLSQYMVENWVGYQNRRQKLIKHYLAELGYPDFGDLTPFTPEEAEEDRRAEAEEMSWWCCLRQHRG